MSPSSTAVVRIAAASEPALASVRAKAATAAVIAADRTVAVKAVAIMVIAVAIVAEAVAAEADKQPHIK